MAKMDLTGEKYGLLTVLYEGVTRAYYTRHWHCECTCGNKIEVSMSHLRSGHTKSCGCYQKANPSNKTHGKSHTKLYKVWDGMVQRCTNPKADGYPKYGARGVTVCEAWLKDSNSFLIWAEAQYKEGLTIERLDAYKGYSPANCTWVPRAKQGINKRKPVTNTSGFVGVSYHKTKKAWIARVTVNGKRSEIGKFSSPELADEARKNYFILNNLPDQLRAYELQHRNK